MSAPTSELPLKSAISSKADYLRTLLIPKKDPCSHNTSACMPNPYQQIAERHDAIPLCRSKEPHLNLRGIIESQFTELYARYDKTQPLKLLSIGSTLLFSEAVLAAILCDLGFDVHFNLVDPLYSDDELIFWEGLPEPQALTYQFLSLLEETGFKVQDGLSSQSNMSILMHKLAFRKWA
jgi:hypothetical protein